MLLSISGDELKAINGIGSTYKSDILEKLNITKFDMLKLIAGGTVTKTTAWYELSISDEDGFNLYIKEEFTVDFLTCYSQNLSEVASPVVSMLKSIKELVAMHDSQNKRFNDMLNKYL